MDDKQSYLDILNNAQEGKLKLGKYTFAITSGMYSKDVIEWTNEFNKTNKVKIAGVIIYTSKNNL